MNEPTPAQEAEQLVDDIADDERSQIAEEHNQLINKIVGTLNNFREMNVVFSETRRRLDKK